MPTILQLIPSLGSGGAEQACIDVAAGLVAARHRAIIVSSGGSRWGNPDLKGVQKIIRPVHSKNPAVILANALWLRKFILKNKVNIVHARSRAPAWSAYLATRGTKCKFVTTFHAAYKFSCTTKKFYNSVMAKADKIIAISDFIAKHVTETYTVASKIIRTIPRGIDMDMFDPAHITTSRKEKLREAWGVAENQKIILLPARLSPIKGQIFLIEAMNMIAATHPEVLAILVGDDQGRHGYRRELENMITEYNLDEQVKLVGNCTDMPAAYSLASLVVAPSVVPEGFGRTPVEAISMGVPVVASDLGGFRETIQHGVSGWLIPPQDAEKLAGAMLHAISLSHSQITTMTELAARALRTRYNTCTMVADTLQVYSEVIGIPEPRV
jgi:glycosyltransferase involved in cell wall biosynthesis